MELIVETCDSLKDLLLYKNGKYGDSALHPIQIFAKDIDPQSSIRIRLDDKISRIANEEEPRKNDIADMLGYEILLCISLGWTSFEEFKD
jgi:hypothetical protein